jgi:hypothetical protein
MASAYRTTVLFVKKKINRGEKGSRKSQKEKAMGLLLKEQENATMPVKARGKLLPEMLRTCFLLSMPHFI